MSRKAFPQAVKQQAVNAMAAGNLTQKQIADKFECSVAALQAWRKELADNAADDADNDDTADYTATGNDTPDRTAKRTADRTANSMHKKKTHGTRSSNDTQNSQELMRQFWNENYRAVDFLLTPKDISTEDAVKLVNEALRFASKQK